MKQYLWSEKEQVLYRNEFQSAEEPNKLLTQRFDPWLLSWQGTHTTPDNLTEITPLEAIKKLQPQLRRLPIGVIGPREASDDELKLAHELGSALADIGLQLICGGKNGVMEAAARGYHEAGGLAIGVLPDEDWRLANDYIAIPIASGIGRARNAILAQACPVLIAVGGGYGTLSEMAFGLQFNQMVLALGDAPQVEGVIYCGDILQVLIYCAERLLSLPV